ARDSRAPAGARSDTSRPDRSPRLSKRGGSSSRRIGAPQRFDLEPRPRLYFLIAFGVAVERAFEIAEGDHETGPAVDEATLENIMFQESPEGVAECPRHRYALMRELGHAQRGIAVHLLDDFFEIAERELPDRVCQRADRLAA